MHFDIVDFRLLVNIVNHRSFTKGAESSHISTPAASNRIKHLESQLGFPLLDRNGREVTPTAAGEIYYRHAIRVIANIAELKNELLNLSSMKSKTIKVKATPSSIHEFLEMASIEFLKAHPEVTIELNESHSEVIVSDLFNTEIDIGVITDRLAVLQMDVFELGSSRVVALAPAGHTLALREHVNFRELAAHNFIGMQAGSVWSDFIERVELASHVKLRMPILAANPESLIRLVSSGMGVSIMSEGFLNGRRDGVAVVALTDDWAERHHKLCVRNFAHLPGHVQDYVSHIVANSQR